MNKREFNSDGTLKQEAREQMLAQGMSLEAINSYALRLKVTYEELKKLDETDPETWVVYTAEDFFTTEEKRQFNPDGSLKPEFLEEAKNMGITEQWLEEMVRRKQIDIHNYNAVSAHYAECGINFGEEEMTRIIGNSATYAQRRRQMQRDLANFEDRDSLPFDPDTAF